jgi:hypothetical protein
MVVGRCLDARSSVADYYAACSEVDVIKDDTATNGCQNHGEIGPFVSPVCPQPYLDTLKYL